MGLLDKLTGKGKKKEVNPSTNVLDENQNSNASAVNVTVDNVKKGKALDELRAKLKAKQELARSATKSQFQ